MENNNSSFFNIKVKEVNQAHQVQLVLPLDMHPKVYFITMLYSTIHYLLEYGSNNKIILNKYVF